MGGLDLAAGLIVLLLLFKRLNLRFGQDDAFLGNLSFQRFQPAFEVRQIMPQPDRPDARGRDKDTQFAAWCSPTHSSKKTVDGRETNLEQDGYFRIKG